MLLLVCNLLFWHRNADVISQISEPLVFVFNEQGSALIEITEDTKLFKQEEAIVQRLNYWSQQICYDEILVKEEEVPIHENFVEYISAIRQPQQLTLKERAVDLVVPKHSDLVAARRLFNNHNLLKNKT